MAIPPMRTIAQARLLVWYIHTVRALYGQYLIVKITILANSSHVTCNHKMTLFGLFPLLANLQISKTTIRPNPLGTVGQVW